MHQHAKHTIARETGVFRSGVQHNLYPTVSCVARVAAVRVAIETVFFRELFPDDCDPVAQLVVEEQCVEVIEDLDNVVPGSWRSREVL